VNAIFIELPAFSRYRMNYLNDETFRSLQEAMMRNPEAGDVIEGTGGLRKLRHGNMRRGKGKRGGLRVIYYSHLMNYPDIGTVLPWATADRI
jgi:hypothetical protein